MGKKTRLASFCRLCLTKTKNKVPVFDDGGSAVENLLQLIEIQINPHEESDAVVCFDCVVTLEGFFQFKEQCHVNDEFVKAIPSNADSSNPPEEELEEEISCDYLDEDVEGESDEEKVVKATVKSNKSPPKRKASSPKKKAAKQLKKSVSTDSLYEDNIEEEGATLNVTSRASKGPTVDEIQVLADSYPDYFYFEKGPRSIYFTLVFYGERFHSALFTERYTYWQCMHRRKFQCPAQVAVTNDYKTFERRYEHTHGEQPEKEGKIFTPLEAIPELFKACRAMVMRNREKRRQRLLEKQKIRNTEELLTDEEIQLDDQTDGNDPLNSLLRKSGVYEDDGEENPDTDDD